MKRLNFRDGAYVSVYDKLHVLPSVREKAFESIFDKTNIYSIKDLCLTNREKLLSLPEVSINFVDGIEYYLSKHGLRFGMTMDEIYEYMDEAYLEELEAKAFNAEEIVPTNSKNDSSSTEDTSKNESETKTEKKCSTYFETVVILCAFLGALTAITLKVLFDCLCNLF